MDVEGADEPRRSTELELLQELRIVQTGGQMLIGFLLVAPFQDCFAEISGVARAL